MFNWTQKWYTKLLISLKLGSSDPLEFKVNVVMINS